MKFFVFSLVLLELYLFIFNVYNTDKKELLCYNFISGGARMSERELDSSINDYIETETPKNYVKQSQWDMAIGLQEVDSLKPSKYLEKLLQENVTGEKTIYT